MSKASPRLFPLKDVLNVFGVGMGAHADIGPRIETFLATLPRNMRPNGSYTVGVFKRVVAEGFTVWPNWFVQNKATYRFRNGLDYISVAQSGELSVTQENTGRSLMSYCKEFQYTQCDPWIVHDNENRIETYAVVAWQHMQDSTDMYCITTNGYRTLDQNGRPVRW